MKAANCRTKILVPIVAFVVLANAQASVTLTNPILFVTQVQMPRENNGVVSNSFVSVVSLFGNHRADTLHAGRGGDLWLMTTNQGLVNLTRRAGFGTNGAQDGIGIGVRDPAVHWSGKKAIFSMVVGAPTNATDPTAFCWQLHEVTNLDAVIASTNTMPVIQRVPNQPANFNNVNPCYATDDRIIFMTDKPIAAAAQIYPELEEYKGQPTVSGTWSLHPTQGDLRLLNHAPSGAFNPSVDSFGRIIETRWDHLSQDPNATDDRLNIQTNGSFNFLSEATNAGTAVIVPEIFPEPRNFDGPGLAQSKTRGNSFNSFFPWMLPEAGGAEEVINHVGRHEFLGTMLNSFTNDVNLLSFTNLASRTLIGVISANTNFINNFFQITEDPTKAGTYFAVDAPDFSPGGGSHTAGRIIAFTGGPNVNPNAMVFMNVTTTAALNTSPLLYRNPLPMSDGRLIAAVTSATNFTDVNLGTDSGPRAYYQFRLMLLTNAGPGSLYSTNQFLTPGLTNVARYWVGSTVVTQSFALWELQPVEVRARAVPQPWNPGVAGIEAAVFTNENVDLAMFQTDLAQRGLALVVSRNVTARDANDKQQPYNLRVPGGASSIASGGKVYDITHLQFFQADYLRGYTLGSTNTANAIPGRRALATPMHDGAPFNYASSRSNPPVGGTQLMPDGSQATIVPANRALTWHLTGTNNNDSVVKERYWITFRPGEVRTCANCHGLNDKDQLGRTAPANPPQALQQLLRVWRTNVANAYPLTVNNGNGGGSFGAGSIVTLTANPAPSGMAFSHWSGGNVGSTATTTTSFIMPTNGATITAVFTNLPPPTFVGSQVSSGNSLTLTAQAFAGQPWVLESSSNLVDWLVMTTNPANAGGVWQYSLPVGASPRQQFFRLRSP